MKYRNVILAIYLLLFFGSFSVLEAQIVNWQCLLMDDDSTQVPQTFGSSSTVCSPNGHTLPATGTIRILIVFGQVEYNVPMPDYDPNPNGNPDWPVNALPVWANQLLDQQVSATPNGSITRYYKEASSGNYNVIGDVLIAPNQGVFTFTNGGYNVGVSNLIQAVNTQSSGVFQTFGQLQQADFDLWTKTSTGQPKITPSIDSPMKYDCVAFIWRNLRTWDGTYNSQTGLPNYKDFNDSGEAIPSGFSDLLLGYRADTHLNFGTHGGNPNDIFRHEYAHLILGGNNFHCAGGGITTNYWIPFTGGHSMLGLSGSALRSWNAWDRYRLNWQTQANSHLISARTASGQEVNGDLDTTNPAHSGTYILRDFVVTGDAIRIKLPFLNPVTEYEQWLWLENHRGFANNGNEFDKYNYQNSTACVDPVEWGLSVAIQIDRELKCGSNIYGSNTNPGGGFMDYVRALSADGMWERSFDNNLQQDACTQWNSRYPSEKLVENSLTGYGDNDWYPYDFSGNGQLNAFDEKLLSGERVNGTVNWKLYSNGHPRQMFRLGGNDRIGIYTNPASTTQMNQIVTNNSGSDVRTVYLNGIHVQIMSMHQNGDMEVKIDFDKVDIEADTRWCAPDIVLNQIPTPSGYSLNIKSSKTLTLDHGASATRMNNPITFEGEEIFTSPTVMKVKSGATINMEAGSTIKVDRRSKLLLEQGSNLIVRNGARLILGREGVLELGAGSTINVEQGGTIIIESSSGNYGSGKLLFQQGARINLNSSTALIDMYGEIAVGDGATFSLSSDTDPLRTKGKLFFRQGTNTQFTAGTGSGISVMGSSNLQEVVLNEKTVMEFPQNLVLFSFQDLRISQEYARRLVPPKSNSCQITFNNCLITSFNALSGYQHYGIWLYGQSQLSIHNCIFQYAITAVTAYSNDLGNTPLLTKTKIEDSQTGVFTYGRGLRLSECEVVRCQKGWVAWHTSAPSHLYKVKMNNAQQHNIDYQGASPLLIEFSTIEIGTFGVHVQQGTLRVSCSIIRNHSTAGIRLVNGASLNMASPLGNSRLTSNTRSISLSSANLFDLHNGFNDLRPTTAGVQGIVNGTLVCFGPTSIAANRNIWKTPGGPPNATDYSVSRLCSPAVQATITDSAPINFMAACPEPEPGLLSGEMLIQNENLPNDASEPEDPLIVAWENLMAQLEEPYNNILDGMGGLSMQSINWSSGTEIDTKVAAVVSMAQMLTNESTIQSIGHFRTLKGYETAFSSWTELKSLSEPNTSIEVAVYGNADIEVGALQNFLQNYFENNGAAHSSTFTLLDQAQYQRILGNYETAMQKAQLAAITAPTDTLQALANRVHCMLQLESIGQAQLIDENTGSGDCLTTSSKSNAPPSKPDSTEQSANQMVAVYPNPTDGLLYLQSLSGDKTKLESSTYDLAGRLVFSSMSSTVLDISALPSGLYILHIKSEAGAAQTFKIVKQ